jgi:hypothetical protein
VIRAGGDVQSFVAGDRLADHVAVFVRAGAPREMKVTSHVENLAQSACKQAAGDRLWCGTCHDPHTVPRREERVSWFRSSASVATRLSPVRRRRADGAPRETTARHVTCRKARSVTPSMWSTRITRFDELRRHLAPSRRTRCCKISEASPAPIATLGWHTRSWRSEGIAGPTGHAHWCYSGPSWTAAQTMRRRCFTWPICIIQSPDRERAIPLYEKAIHIDPAQLTGSVSLGAIRMEQGNHADPPVKGRAVKESFVSAGSKESGSLVVEERGSPAGRCRIA